MRFGPVLVVALLVLLVSGAIVAAGLPGSDGAGAMASSESVSEDFERADPGLVVTIQLKANGNARWHVTHRFKVNGSNETTAFEEFTSSVKNGETDVGAGRDTYARFADAASEATGREMQIENAGWTSSRIANGTGELTYSFTWTNFGRVRGEQVLVGDAFRSPNGTWFPRLYDGQRLVVRPPSGLNIVQTPPDKGLNQRALVWDGYREFEPGYLSMVLERPSETMPTTTTTTTGTNVTTPPGGDPDEGLSPFLLGVGFALLLVFVGAGSYFFARWQTMQENGGDGGSGAVTEASDGGSRPDSGASERTDTATSAGSQAGSAAATAGVGAAAESSEQRSGAVEEGAAGAVADTEPESDDEDEIDETLLSDEERVLRLLEGNGGRMKQANIVTETGWSNAKVSQLLSGMDEDDEIQKLRIGRENLITLPDENVADFGDDE